MKGPFSLSSFIGGIVLGGILASAWFFGNSMQVLDTAQTGVDLGMHATSTDASLPAGSPSGAIEVRDQPAGPAVIIDTVTVPPPGVWIAVREVSEGALGNVLGAALVGGPRADVSVQLLRDTTPGATYAVELYRDNGDGVFDLDSDSVYVDFDSGTRVIDYFKTTP